MFLKNLRVVVDVYYKKINLFYKVNIIFILKQGKIIDRKKLEKLQKNLFDKYK